MQPQLNTTPGEKRGKQGRSGKNTTRRVEIFPDPAERTLEPKAVFFALPRYHRTAGVGSDGLGAPKRLFVDAENQRRGGWVGTTATFDPTRGGRGLSRPSQMRQDRYPVDGRADR